MTHPQPIGIGTVIGTYATIEIPYSPPGSVPRPWFCTGCGVGVAKNVPLCGACHRLEAAKERKRHVASALERIPERFAWTADPESPFWAKRCKAPKARALALEVALRSTFTGAVFVGDSGRGKSSLAALVFRTLLERARRDEASAELQLLARGAFWVDGYELAQARAQHARNAGEASKVRQAKRAGLLVIDEIAPRDTWGDATIADVINERWRRSRPTIATTFADADMLAQRFGDGIARKLLEGAAVIRMGEP